MPKIKEVITIQNVSKRDFTILKEVEGKMEPRLLRKGSVFSLPKEYAEKLLKDYPLELKDLTQVVKIVETDNSKKIKVELELSKKQIKKLEKKIKEVKEKLVEKYEKEIKEKDSLIVEYEKEIEKLKNK